MTKRKILSVFFSVLMIIGAIATFVPESKVEAEGQAHLTADATINKMFSNLNILTSGYAGMKAVTVDGITWEVFCADPDVLTYVGAEYDLQKYPDFYSLPGDMQAAGKVLLNWYTNYNGAILQGSSAEYYAVQLAIWGAQKGVDPAGLIPIDPNNATAIKIRDLASALYNASWSYPTETVAYNGDGKTYDYSNMSGTQAVYKFPGSDQYYYRSELLGVTVNGLTEHLHYNVSLSDNSLGIKITDSHNNEASEFGYGTNHGTGFYIYTPINRLEQAKTVTVNVSNITYAKLGIALWTGTAQRLINRYAYQGEHAGFSTVVKLPTGTAPTPEPDTLTGDICIIKEGYVPTGAITSEEDGETKYRINWDRRPLQGADFGIFRKEYDSNDYINLMPNNQTVESPIDGKICFQNIVISSEMNTEIRILEHKAPIGYLALKQSTNGQMEDGRIFQNFTFDPTTAVDGNVHKMDFTFENTPKHFEVEITKTDSKTGAPLPGAKFGLYSTEEIITYDGTVIPANSLLETGTTGPDGKLTFGSSVPVNQNYLVKEISAPENYDKSLGVTVIDTADFIANKEGTHKYTLNITNDPTVIDIGTTATFSDNSKEKAWGEGLEIIDHVSHSGLTENKSYKLVTWLMDKETEEQFSDKLTTNVTAKEGELFEVNIPVDHTKITKTTDLVVYEELYDGEKLIADHKVLTDGGQTVKVIKEKPITFGTQAKNKQDNTQVIRNIPNVVIEDTASYEGFEPNKEHTIIGKLWNKTKEEFFKENGKEVSVEYKFTPTSENGSEKLEFTIDASSLTAEDVLVVFEEVYVDGKLLIDHNNPNDTKQTVTVKELKIGTTATVNGKKEVDLGGNITIDDKVDYESLIVGQEFGLNACLVWDDETPVMVGDKQVCQETTFTPTTENGSETVSITFDSSALGAGNIVVYEELLLNGKVVAEHKDPTSTKQTVTLKSNITGQIHINKHDSTDPDKKAPMEGVQFILTSTDGTVTKQAKTDAKGVVVFDGLDITKEYRLEETVPANYRLVTDLSDNIVFDVNNVENNLITVLLNVDNEKIEEKGGIKIIKSDSESGEKLHGAEFALYDSTNKEVRRGITNKEGILEFTDLPLGTYTLREETLPVGYMYRNGVSTWRITLRTPDKIVDAELVNVPFKATFEVIKKDYNTQSKVVPGATYALYDMATNKLIEEKTTDSSGKIVFDNNGAGFKFGSAYYMKETKAASGYELDSAQYDFIVNDASTNNRKISVLSKTVYDKPTVVDQYGKLKIVKVDKDNEATKLANAEFGIYASTDTSYKNPLHTVKTGSDGTVTIEKLAFGEYFVKEIAAPNGYRLNGSAFKVRITASAVTNPLELKVTNQKETNPVGVLKIQKYIDGTSTPLKGAEFTLYGNYVKSTMDQRIKEGYTYNGGRWLKPDGTNATNEEMGIGSAMDKVIATGVTDDKGQIEWKDLVPAQYVLKETKVPSGYSAKAEQYNVNLSSKGSGFTESVTVYNVAGTTPSKNSVVNTGELGKNPWFYAGLVAVGLAALGGTLYYRKRRDN